MSEAHLISRVLAGDRMAGRELYDAHAPRVFRLAYRMTRDEEVARECTQDTFVLAFRRLSGFRGEAALSTWVHRIAVFVILQTLRTSRRRAERYVDLEEAETVHATDHQTDPDLKECLQRELDALPEIYRTTLILHDLEGYAHSAIAELLEIPEGTSTTRLSCARAKLRNALIAFREE
ncbi:MAG: RNA polymerase sigma factor [Gemmatimonadaceae bacterium]